MVETAAVVAKAAVAEMVALVAQGSSWSSVPISAAKGAPEVAEDMRAAAAVAVVASALISSSPTPTAIIPAIERRMSLASKMVKSPVVRVEAAVIQATRTLVQGLPHSRAEAAKSGSSDRHLAPG